MGELQPAGPLLVAPLSRRPCLAWVLMAELTSGRVLDALGSRFAVMDDDRSVLVEGSRGGYDLSDSAQLWEGPCPSRLPPMLRAFLLERGVSRSTVAGARLRELVLLAGDRVDVSGLPAEEVATDADYRGLERTTVLSDGPGAPLRLIWVGGG